MKHLLYAVCRNSEKYFPLCLAFGFGLVEYIGVTRFGILASCKHEVDWLFCNLSLKDFASFSYISVTFSFILTFVRFSLMFPDCPILFAMHFVTTSSS